MKINLMFFFLGVVLTVFTMQLFFTPPPVVKVKETTPNLAKAAPIVNKSHQVTIGTNPEKMQATTKLDDEELNQWPVFDQSHDVRAVDYMVAHQIESVMAEFSSVVDGDVVKLKMLAELAGDMMKNDAVAAINLTDESNYYFDYAILDKEDSDLSQEELDEKKKTHEHWSKISEIKEQHRIEYEDSIRNLLTSEELARYQEVEKLKAHRQLLAQAKHEAREVMVGVRDLSDYQRSEINRISNKMADIASDSIPIGYSLGGGSRNLSLDMAKMGKILHGELINLLTDEQTDTLKQNPTMNLH